MTSRFVPVALLATALAAPASARADGAPPAGPFVPVQLSLVPGLGTNLLFDDAGDAVNALSLSVAVGYSAHLRGLGAAPGGFIASGNVHGIVAAAGFTVVGGDLTGLQCASGVNILGGSLLGVQSSSGVNIAGGDVRGAQLAAGVNIAGGTVTGLQSSSGVSIAGDVRGAQISVVNIGGDVVGAQIGVLNIARDVKGTQIGVVNISRDIAGVPVGLVNIVRRGMLAVEGYASTTRLANASVLFGSRHLYTIAGIGFAPQGRELATMLGLGVHLTPGDAFIDLDLSGGHVTGPGRSAANAAWQARALVGYSFAEHFSLFAGVAGDVVAEWNKTMDCGGRTCTCEGPVWEARPALVGGVRF